MRVLPLLLLCACGPSPYATEVVDFQPGTNAGFGQDDLPDIVLGPPRGGGASQGGLDVLSLGCGGVIELGFDRTIVDLEGPDFIVFENPFPAWLEFGEVAASGDGEAWTAFPCDSTTGASCAGNEPVLANPDDNDLDATDPAEAGGDAFDLEEVGLQEANYLRITDTGTNDCQGTSGGFDLDAVAIVGE